ncbi:MAG: flagellar hook-basal body complex protein FliE [Bryobacteraceae bacterium]|jgi:flagellar hook-basal body complex protein FliE
MSAPIVPISIPASAGSITPVAMPGSPASGADVFGAMLSNAIDGVQNLSDKSDQSISRLLSGEGGDLHEVAMDSQKAQLGFEMFLQLRNKVVQAYQQVMQMQL